MSSSVTVYITNGRLEAESLVILLKSFDIVAEVYQESAGATYGFTNAPLGTVQIRVAEQDEVAARDILAALDRGELENPDSD